MAKSEDYPLTLADAAGKLGTSQNAVRRFVAAGRLEAARFGPLREPRFREEDLQAFAAENDPAELDRRITREIKEIEPHYARLTSVLKS